MYFKNITNMLVFKIPNIHLSPELNYMLQNVGVHKAICNNRWTWIMEHALWDLVWGLNSLLVALLFLYLMII